MDSINIQTSNTNKVLYSIKEFAMWDEYFETVFNQTNDIEFFLYIYSLNLSLGLFPLITLGIYLCRRFVETSIQS